VPEARNIYSHRPLFDSREPIYGRYNIALLQSAEFILVVDFHKYSAAMRLKDNR